jgi:hypothetical protein
MIGSSPIFFQSIKQKSQATSGTHAEILAMYEAVTYITWFRHQLQDLRYPQASPTQVEQDNQPSLRKRLQLFEQDSSLDAKVQLHH